MKPMTRVRLLLLSSFFLAAFTSMAQTSTTTTKQKNEPVMKTYLIERDIPGAGNFTPVDLKGISQKSCTVLKDMNGIQWVHSYVTGNKIYCVYKAASEDLIREHGKKGGFPVTNITEINTIISPETAK